MPQIRSFDLAHDYDTVLELWRNAGTGVNIGPSDTREEIAKKLKRDPDLFLVAEEGGEIVGAVLGGYDGRRGMVYHLAVTPSHRKCGIGSALMDELESRLKAKGCYKYYLLVMHDNLDVTDFYRRMGWEEMPVQIMGKVIG